MKLFVVVDPEQGEAVFIHPDVNEFKRFIKELRGALIHRGCEGAEGCSNHDVLEMYGNWVGHIYDAEW